MGENVVSCGIQTAADIIGGDAYQRVKPTLGADGTAVDAVGGAGPVTTGTQRVTLASDDPAVALLGLFSRPSVAAVPGTLASVAAGSPFTPQRERPFNVTVWGTFVASYVIERSFGGSTWHQLTDGGVPVYALAAAVSEMLEEPEPGVSYRLRVTAYTSGTLNYRLSQ